ncbi:hypothetical protein EMCRGX_G007056 [Ephydatia muelleri]
MATGINDDLQAHLIPNLEGLDQRREIGRGAYGAVYEVKLNGLPCIAKGLHQILLGMGGYERVGGKEVETIRAKFLQECSLLSKLKHPNIVQFLGIHRTKEDVLLVMEYMHMDLAKCLDTHPDIPLQLKLSILLDVSYGLLHLHSQTPPIIHRDLTAANVLLTEGLRAKIADLGVSKIFDIQQIQRVAYTAAPGTQAYMPPEALSPTPQYGTKLDVFSFGVLSLYTANQAFPIVHEPTMKTVIIRNREVQIFKRKHWIDKMGVDHPLYLLVVQCLQDHPDQRPSTKELSDMLSGLCTQHPMKRSILENQDLLEEERAKYERELTDLRAQLHSVKDVSNAIESLMQRQLKDLNVQLTEAKEEIAVKEAQVKQYQKQVEAYKQQLSSESSVMERACAAMSHHPSCDPDEGNEDDLEDGLPPPIFHKPFRLQRQLPPHETVPMVPRGAHDDLLSGGRSRSYSDRNDRYRMQQYGPVAVQGRYGSAEVPPGQRSNYNATPAPSKPYSEQMQKSTDLAEGIDDDISAMVRGRMDVDVTAKCTTLDPNLKYPLCGTMFKKGEIQKLKCHAEACTR